MPKSRRSSVKPDGEACANCGPSKIVELAGKHTKKSSKGYAGLGYQRR